MVWQPGIYYAPDGKMCRSKSEARIYGLKIKNQFPEDIQKTKKQDQVAGDTDAKPQHGQDAQKPKTSGCEGKIAKETAATSLNMNEMTLAELAGVSTSSEAKPATKAWSPVR